jgi:hypothetical protein
MIVTSIHDPALFTREHFVQHKHYMGRIIDRLRIVAQCHLIAIDGTDNGSSSMFNAMYQLASQNPMIQSYLNAVLRQDRLVRVPPDAARLAKIREFIPTSGSAEAVALAGYPGVDACILDEDTFAAAQLGEIKQSKLTTLADYHTSEAFGRENLVFGGKPVSDLTKAEFLDKIIRPVVFWAEQVTIIDKMIGKAAFGAEKSGNTSGIPSTNWQHFKTTICEIFKLWDKGANSSRRRLRIITESVTNVMNDGVLAKGDWLAAELACRLSIPNDRIQVILKNADTVKNIDHDRYLLTNHSFVIGISRGFDVLKNDEKCAVSDVYLRQAQSQNDILSQLTNTKRGTAGAYPCI